MLNKHIRQKNQLLVTAPVMSLSNSVRSVGSWVAWVTWVRGWRGSNFLISGVGSVGP